MSRTASLRSPRRTPTRPLRRRIALSQNFLTDSRTIETILDRSSVGPDDVVYEIGPGDGAITARLAPRCRHVVAVEKDPQLAERLRRRFLTTPNVTVFLADCLTFPLPVTQYKVFANIPFAITAAIITRLTEASYPPEDTYLCVQREAAQRFIGAPRETLVSLLLKPSFEPSVVHCFERGDFTPAPGVEVVLLRLRKRGPPLLTPSEAPSYRDFVTHAFTARAPSLRRFEEWLKHFRRFQVSATPRSREKVRGAEARLREQQAGLQKEHRTRVHS
jgi:23S rRNA (adenine-N6)-dimethyltransferase